MSRIEEINKMKKDNILFSKTNLKEKYNNSNFNSFIKTYISNDNKKNNLDLSPNTYDNIKHNGKVNHTIFWAKTVDNKKKPKKIFDAHLLNTSSDISNLNTQLNSNTKRTFTNTNINSYHLKNDKEKIKYNSKFTDEKIGLREKKKIVKKNTISFVDRKKIKKLNKSTLKLYEIYLQKNNQALRADESPDKNISFLNKNYYISDELDNFNNTRRLSTDSSSIVANKGLTQNHKNKIKKNLKKFNTERKYGLKQLMNLNPYHYVSSMVRYCNSIEMKNISEKLSTVNGATFNRKATSKLLFFKNEKNNIRKNKVINSFSVAMNDNLSFKGEFVWRILAKINKANSYSSFYNSCKYKGYYELWKYYSVLIEQLLVKYKEFKWFLEKNKYIQEDVFKEFLTCIKIENKKDNSFTNKVFLLFDDDCTGQINIKVFLFIMELISKSSNNIEKINFCTELFTDIKLINENKCINVMEFFEIFKKIIDSPNYKREIKILYDILKKEFNEGQIIENILFISKKQLFNFLLNNKFIQKIIQAFKTKYKHANILYNEEINGSFNSTVRTVKKFLNEQNEVIKMSINECDKLEYVLKAMEEKGKLKNRVFNLENDIHNNSNKEE